MPESDFIGTQSSTGTANRQQKLRRTLLTAAIMIGLVRAVDRRAGHRTAIAIHCLCNSGRSVLVSFISGRPVLEPASRKRFRTVTASR